VAASNGTAYVAWNGSHFATPQTGGVTGPHVYFDSFPIVHGSLAVTGTDGKDTMIVRSPTGNPNVVEVFDGSGGRYSGLWSGLDSLTVSAAGGDDDIVIENSVAGLPYSVDAGAGNDLVEISPIARNLSNIQGGLGIEAGPGVDKITFSDQDNPLEIQTNYTLGGTSDHPTLQRTFSALISYHGFNSRIEIDGGNHTTSSRSRHVLLRHATTLNGGLGNDTFNVLATAGLVINPSSAATSSTSATALPITSTINGIHGA
jgi:hypothetical protein